MISAGSLVQRKGVGCDPPSGAELSQMVVQDWHLAFRKAIARVLRYKTQNVSVQIHMHDGHLREASIHPPEPILRKGT
jgi:hypothetical protein